MIQPIVQEVQVLVGDQVYPVVVPAQAVAIVQVAQQGLPGVPGAGQLVVTKTNNEAFTVRAGQPVKLEGTTGAALARADTLANVAHGVVSQDAATGATLEIMLVGIVQALDWTPIIGAPSLTPGSEYFLVIDVAGLLTPVPPNGVASGQCQYIGVAIDANRLFVQVARPLAL